MTFRKCKTCGETTLASYYSRDGSPPPPAHLCECDKKRAQAVADGVAKLMEIARVREDLR